MKTASIAETKTQLSSLITAVEAGEDVLITRRGQPVARLVAEPGVCSFGWAALRGWVSSPSAAGLTVAELREQDLL